MTSQLNIPEAEDAALGRMHELCSVVQSLFVHSDTAPRVSSSEVAELDRELLWDEIDGRCGRDAV